MLSYGELTDIMVFDIDYQRDNYGIDFGCDEDGVMWIEVTHERPDAYTGESGTGRGGKRIIRPEFTKSDVVRTVFGALVAYEEHEVREFFLFRGARIFSPHIDYYAENTDVQDAEVKRLRKSLGTAWGYVLAGLLEDQFDDGTSVFKHLLESDPVLAQRFRKAFND